MAWVGIPSLKPCTRLYARLHNPASLNVSGPALMLRVRPRYSSIRFFVRIGASLLLAPIVSNRWLSGIALRIYAASTIGLAEVFQLGLRMRMPFSVTMPLR